MKLADLRKLSIKQQTRIHFQLQNGMECVITEHGIAQVPGLQAIPDFNLEQELAAAREFTLEPLQGEKKTARPVNREQLAALLAPAADTAHSEHEED